MRKKNELLREQLLDSAREIATREGTEAINIRRLASQAGIASGTVYNYFQSKEDVLLALTEEYWRKAMAEMRQAIHADTFTGQVREIYAFLRSRIDDSAGVLMGSLRNVEAVGRERMTAMQTGLRMAIVQRMEADGGIRATVWNERFTKERYADFVLANLLMLLQKKEDSIDFFLDILERTLY